MKLMSKYWNQQMADAGCWMLDFRKLLHPVSRIQYPVSVLITALLSLTLIFLAASPLHADSFNTGSPTSRTPYDAYMGPMWVVFKNLNGPQPDIGSVQSYIRQGHSFRYYFNSAQPYTPQTPEQTEKSGAGDCKAKSLWLAYKMDTPKVRYVIGKARAVSTISHAWLMWQGPNGWLILDATNFSQPLEPAHLAPTDFIPLYSYSSSGKYVHAVTSAGQGAKYGDHL
jgi:hypothetical protein